MKSPRTYARQLYRSIKPDSAQDLVLIGEQDQIDCLSYEGLEEQPDYVRIDGHYIRTVAITGYPLVATSGWLDSLLQFSHDIDISYHVREIAAMIALPKLQRKITELESTRRAMVRRGSIVGSEITDPLASAEDLRDKIQRGQEKLFHLSIYAALRADTLEELTMLTKRLEHELASRLFSIRTARYQQVEGMQSILPRGDNQLGQQRNIDTSALALTFPFASSECVHEDGILYGINQSSKSLVMVDRFQLHNANSIVFAQSGSGKSYASKIEILRHLMQGTPVIVIDPEREYERLAESVEGSYIRVSAHSDIRLNPFDIVTRRTARTRSAQIIQTLISILTVMVGGVDATEKAGLDAALVRLYARQTSKGLMLGDLVKALPAKKYAALRERLNPYATGSLAHLFNGPTNVELDSRLVVFDIKDLPENVRQIMMMIIATYVEQTVQAQPRRRVLVIDEGWLLLEHEESARFIAGLVRRARKYYLGVSIISQQANDFLSDVYGRAIASQSSLRILMRQDTTTIDQVVHEFHLSEYERQYLLTCGRGEALCIADQTHVAVRIIASDQEHPLITTNPREIYAH